MWDVRCRKKERMQESGGRRHRVGGWRSAQVRLCSPSLEVGGNKPYKELSCPKASVGRIVLAVARLIRQVGRDQFCCRVNLLCRTIRPTAFFLLPAARCQLPTVFPYALCPPPFPLFSPVPFLANLTSHIPHLTSQVHNLPHFHNQLKSLQ